MKFSLIIPVAPDRTAPILNYIKNLDYSKENYEFIVEYGTNASENRNRGIQKAKYDILCFLDDDAELPKDYLKNIEKFFKKNPEIDVVGGPQLTPKSDPFFAKVSGYILSSFLGTHKMSNRYKKGELNLDADESYLTSANLIIKKSVFTKTHGYNTTIWPGEDPELICRLKRLGFKIAYSPEIIVYHKRRPTFKGFFKQFFNYGRNYVNYKKRILKERISLLHWMPSLFILYLILLPLLYYNHIVFTIPFILYLILVLIFSIHITISKKHYSAFPYLPFLFFAIHISYGLGLFRGLIKK